MVFDVFCVVFQVLMLVFPRDFVCRLFECVVVHYLLTASRSCLFYDCISWWFLKRVRWASSCFDAAMFPCSATLYDVA